MPWVLNLGPAPDGPGRAGERGGWWGAGGSKTGLKAALWSHEVWAAIACSVTLSIQLWSLSFLICNVG